MKILLLPILLAFWAISFSAFSQTVPVLIAANTNPVLGETFKVWIKRGPVMSNISSGPNQVWNPGPMQGAIPDIFTYQSPATGQPSGYGNNYPHANLYRAIDLGLYEFLETTSTSLKLRGSLTTQPFVPDPAVYNDPAEVLNYPFTYNSTVTDLFSGTQGQYGNIFGKIISTGHGYGTIQTPAGTFNVLCVKTIEVRTDSLGNRPTFPNDSSIIYSFYAPGIHYPVFKSVYRVDIVQPRQWSEYLDAASITGIIAENPNQLIFQAFPNPASSKLTIQYQSQKPVKITLQNLVGKQIAELPAGKGSSGLQRLKVDVSNYPKGVYLLKLETEGQAVFRKLILQ